MLSTYSRPQGGKNRKKEIIKTIHNLRIKFTRRNYVSNAISISVLKAYNLKPHNSKVAARGTQHILLQIRTKGYLSTQLADLLYNTVALIQPFQPRALQPEIQSTMLCMFPSVFLSNSRQLQRSSSRQRSCALSKREQLKTLFSYLGYKPFKAVVHNNHLEVILRAETLV